MRRALVVFCAVIGVTFAAVGFGKPEQKPDKFKDTKGCYVSDLDLVIPLGSSMASTKQCLEYLCSEKWVTIYSCGVIELTDPSPLELIEDLSKPYPECCPQPLNSTAND